MQGGCYNNTQETTYTFKLATAYTSHSQKWVPFHCILALPICIKLTLLRALYKFLTHYIWNSLAGFVGWRKRVYDVVVINAHKWCGRTVLQQLLRQTKDMQLVCTLKTIPRAACSTDHYHCSVGLQRIQVMHLISAHLVSSAGEVPGVRCARSREVNQTTRLVLQAHFCAKYYRSHSGLFAQC